MGLIRDGESGCARFASVTENFGFWIILFKAVDAIDNDVGLIFLRFNILALISRVIQLSFEEILSNKNLIFEILHDYLNLLKKHKKIN